MENRTYSALQIAKYFIKKSELETKKVTNLKLQKILYYAQGWYLANFSKPLFKEKIEAWKYGPVVPIVYRQFKEYGGLPIATTIKDQDINDIDTKTKKFLDEIWQVYGKLTGAELVFLTHKEGSWLEARGENDDGGNSEIEITQGMMEDQFRKKLKDG
jgi:uncharacterized phage-associated protein